MTNLGLILGIISFIFVFLFLALGLIFKRKFKKKQKMILKIILASIGIFGIFWFFHFRYFIDFQNLLKLNNQKDNFERSIYFSKVLLLDLCPFAYVVLCFFMIIDFKDRFINIVAIWAFIGSTITIFGSIWTNEFPLNKWYYFVFIGSKEGALYFWIHIFMLIFSSFFIGYTNRINLTRFLSMHIFVSIYLVYVIIIVKSLNILRNATGLVEFDWMDPLGEYHNVYLFFKIPYIEILFLSYFLVWVGLIIIIGFKNMISFPENQAFFPKIIYKKIKFINNISNKIYKFKCKLWKINSLQLK